MNPEPVDLLQMPLPRRRDNESDWFDLEDWVGPGRPSRRADVAKIEGILAGSGDYSLARTQGPTGWWGLALDDGIRAYQRRNGLAVDGALRPDGPTIRHMRDAFADKLGRWQPPTPDDIDAHHAAIDAGGDDVVAWRPAPVYFDRIGSLPEIDAETDASNARLVRAMGRIGGYGTYPELFARTIGEFGASGLAEVRDLVGKYEAEHPGEGGHLAAEIVSRVPPETLKELGIEVPDGPPPGVKVAAGPAALLPLLPWAGALSIGAAAVHGAKETQKILNQPLPGYTPAPAGNDNRLPPTHVPDSGPTHTGHPAETPTTPNFLPNIPPLSGERRKKIVEGFLDGIDTKLFPDVVESRDGTYVDKRGGPLTIKTNNMGAELIAELISESDCPELIAQDGGASKKGEYEKYLKERVVKALDTVRRPDVSASLSRPKTGIKSEMFLNTVTVDAKGNPIPREVDAAKGLEVAAGGGDRVAIVRKMRPGDDEAEFRKQFKEVLRKAMQPVFDDCKKFLNGFK